MCGAVRLLWLIRRAIASRIGVSRTRRRPGCAGPSAALPAIVEVADDGPHRDLRASAVDDLDERALIERLELDGRLLRLDLGDDVATVDPVADALRPVGDQRRVLVEADVRHLDRDPHLPSPLLPPSGTRPTGDRHPGPRLIDRRAPPG